MIISNLLAKVCGYSHGNNSADLINNHIDNPTRSEKLRAKGAHESDTHESLVRVQWVFFFLQKHHTKMKTSPPCTF